MGTEKNGKYCRCHRWANIQKKKTVLKLDFYNAYCCKYVWVNKAVVGSSHGDTPNYVGGGCGITWPVGWVQWAKWLIQVNEWVILGCFSLCFIKKHHDSSLNVSCSKRVMASYVIIKIHDVTSSYNVVMSLVMPLTAHM